MAIAAKVLTLDGAKMLLLAFVLSFVAPPVNDGGGGKMESVGRLPRRSLS